MKKVLVSVVVTAALLAAGGAFAAAGGGGNPGNGNQGCTTKHGPAKNPGKMFQAIRAEEGLNPAQKAEKNQQTENNRVGEFIDLKCGDPS